jgi:peptidoglycan/xylan/chitin deacetylase (PgdA/CDA1 family)
VTTAGEIRVALKVDIDTHAGLARGVPAIAAACGARGVLASFFVVCGPDRMGRRLARLLDPRFVAKLVRTRAVATYGWRTLLSGTLLPARPVAEAFPEVLRKLVAAGHEVSAHGYDHARWQDRLPRLSAAQVRAEVSRAMVVFRAVFGRSPEGFAAPGWRCTPTSLAAVDEAGFTYRSDTRGSYPYRPTAGGQVFRVPELPTTLPTLDETYGHVSRDPAELADYYASLLHPGVLNVHTIHAELEGGPYLGVLESLLDRVKTGARFVRLCDEAIALAGRELPICSVHEGRLPGRAMPVALQGEATGSPRG